MITWHTSRKVSNVSVMADPLRVKIVYDDNVDDDDHDDDNDDDDDDDNDDNDNYKGYNSASVV